MEIEIAKPLELNDRQAAMVDLHSLLNIINVFLGELYLLSMTVNDARHLSGAIQLAESVKDTLYAQNFNPRLARELQHSAALYEAGIRELFAQQPAMKHHPEIIQSTSNLNSIQKSMAVRLEEFLNRMNEPEHWHCHDLLDLHKRMWQFLAAIEKNSKGRFRFVSNIAAQETNDYLINQKFESTAQNVLRMPKVFQDVLRDLIANARKYTPPGGVIDAGLLNDGRELRLVVQDNGRGIPDGEMARVVDFGYRASNVRDVTTQGGGFGLTKAYWATKKFNGRFWIKSNLGQGTRITIKVPVPETFNPR